MANLDEDELDDKDNLEKAVEAADLDDSDSQEPDAMSLPKAKLESVDEDPEEEINDSEDTGEALASHKTPEEEISDMADEESAKLPKEVSREPASEPKSAQHDQLTHYQNFLEQYKKLQDQRRNSDLVAGLAAAGGKIGQSIAGKYSGQFNPDMTGVQVLQQMANRPVQDFEQQQVVNSRGLQLQGMENSADPNSAQSKLVRDYINSKKILPQPLPDTVSANDAAAIMKMIGKPQVTHLAQLPMVNQQTGEKTMATFNPTLGTFTDIGGNPLGAGWVRDYRAQSFVDPASHERLSFSGGTGKVAGSLTGPGVNRPLPPVPSQGEAPVELNRQMLTSQQAKQLDQTRKEFMHEVKDDRKAVNSSDRVLQVLDAGQDFGDLPAELQDQMSRSFGQTGHITDSQMGRVLGRADWKSRLQGAWSLYTEGKLDDENRDFLREVMTVIKDQNQQFIKNKAKAHVSNLYKDFSTSPNLQKYKITPDQLGKMISVEEAASSSVSSKNRMLIDNRNGQLVPIQPDKYDAALKAKDSDGKPLFTAPAGQ